MKNLVVSTCCAALMALALPVCAQLIREQQKIDLSGEWHFQADSLDKGIPEQWFSKTLTGRIKLPGSMTTNGMGNEIDIHTPWTGSIVDSGWFTQPQYAQYRKPGNIKVPFWLQPVKYYKGAAWYQKKVSIPAAWKGRRITIYIERSHWETTLWIDNRELGMQNSLSTPHIYELPANLPAGAHVVTIRVDNRVKDIDPGPNSHSISDHTQSNWNGMIGKLYMAAAATVYISRVDLYPDIENKLVRLKVEINNSSGQGANAALSVGAVLQHSSTAAIKPLTQKIQLNGTVSVIDLVYPMGSNPLLWDEFSHNLYKINVKLLQDGKTKDENNTVFGMRHFAARGTQFSINGRPVFLRGTLECAIFPKTGYPPTDIPAWMRIFKIARAYGLNHMRFHSWCPPEAAFTAADRCGFYLQVECTSWANQGAVIGDGKPLDKFIYEESERIVKAYGNHPSFCMMVYGNEPAGKNHVQYLKEFVQYWKDKDNRRLYTTGSGWPVVAETDYNSSPDPRIQAWGQGLKSIINSQPPATDYDWRSIISKWQQPTVSHEIGQWCVYPDFKEIKKYTGVLKAKNFEIFQQTLTDNGMKSLADSFLLASGKLQALCYKADIEAALRTPGFGGFQLLDLHDFPGQGTALVGVLNPFWEDKGYITAKEYSHFCNAVVPLARMKKLVYENNENLEAAIEIANFGNNALTDIINWTITDTKGAVLYRGSLPKQSIAIGNGLSAGNISQALSGIQQASRCILTVCAGAYKNTWDFFVYPAKHEDDQKTILVTQQLDAAALDKLDKGGKVLLSIRQGALGANKGGDIQIGFSSIFWNTAWTHAQPPVTLGILCNPAHPALKAFPTQYFSNFQWQDAMRHSNAIRLDSVAPGITPIVRVIDDWVTARPLGLLFECKMGRGSLMVSGIDLLTDASNRPEARQLLHSLLTYMNSAGFRPRYHADKTKLESLL